MATDLEPAEFTFADFAPPGEEGAEAWPAGWSPAVRTTEDGHSFLATTDFWRKVCRIFPCSIWLDWPGYATAAYPTKIDGKRVVIQAWKGWCQQMPLEVGPVIFPGGIGAEVGIYSLDPPWQQESIGPFAPQLWPIHLRSAFDRWVKRRFSDPHDPQNSQLWWPDVDVVTDEKQVTFTLFDPEFDEPLIKDYSTATYWTCKWMEKASYLEWRKGRKPTRKLEVSPLLDPDQYVLEFTVNDVEYRWADKGIVPV